MQLHTRTNPALSQKFTRHLEEELEDLKAAGLYKAERIITSPQSANIQDSSGEKVLNFCANNYLGLADPTELIEAAKAGLDR